MKYNTILKLFEEEIFVPASPEECDRRTAEIQKRDAYIHDKLYKAVTELIKKQPKNSFWYNAVITYEQHVATWEISGLTIIEDHKEAILNALYAGQPEMEKFDDVFVYATPFWEICGGIPIQIYSAGLTINGVTEYKITYDEQTDAQNYLNAVEKELTNMINKL